MLRPMSFILTVALVFPFVTTSGLRADTVFLKNGAYIDGIVTTRSEKSILISIGSIGKIEIETEIISHIEKNSRTGSRERVPVDSRELELPESLRSRQEEGGADASQQDTENEASGSEDEESEGQAVDEERTSVKDDDEAEALDPKLREEIEQAIRDLERQKSKYRWRAERKLRSIGEPAVPFLLPLARSPSELTRTIVMRFFAEYADGSDDEIMEAILSGLDDDKPYVRNYAVHALRRITGRGFNFRATGSSSRRYAAREKWGLWWEAEKEKRNAEEKGEKKKK